MDLAPLRKAVQYRTSSYVDVESPTDSSAYPLHLPWHYDPSLKKLSRDATGVTGVHGAGATDLMRLVDWRHFCFGRGEQLRPTQV